MHILHGAVVGPVAVDFVAIEVVVSGGGPGTSRKTIFIIKPIFD